MCEVANLNNFIYFVLLNLFDNLVLILEHTFIICKIKGFKNYI